MGDAVCLVDVIVRDESEERVEFLECDVKDP